MWRKKPVFGFRFKTCFRFQLDWIKFGDQPICFRFQICFRFHICFRFQICFNFKIRSYWIVLYLPNRAISISISISIYSYCTISKDVIWERKNAQQSICCCETENKPNVLLWDINWLLMYVLYGLGQSKYKLVSYVVLEILARCTSML